MRRGDPELRSQARDLSVFNEGLAPELAPEEVVAAIEVESIAMRRQRPVLAIKKNETDLTFGDEADVAIWSDRLRKAKPFLDVAIPAVGRIDLQRAPLDWVGTGWLIADDVLVTNRHVARLFVAAGRGELTFTIGPGGPFGADVDFLQEFGNQDRLVFKLRRPLYVESEPGPDVAFFEVDHVSGVAAAKPIALSRRMFPTPNVAVIGYPAFDSRIPEPELMARIYGSVYNKKRLAPGGVTRVEDVCLLHDCTTLGGNSGSVVLDLDAGEALGLHFSGSFLTTNYAVRADVVGRLLDKIRARPPIAVVPVPDQAAAKLDGGDEVLPPVSPPPSVSRLTIPLSIELSFKVSIDKQAADATTATARVETSCAAAIDEGDGSWAL